MCLDKGARSNFLQVVNVGSNPSLPLLLKNRAIAQWVEQEKRSKSSFKSFVKSSDSNLT